MSKYHANSMSDVKYYNRQAGFYFFAKETIDFWGTKVETSLFKNNTFVTSENNFYETKRLFTVRRYNPTTAEIDTEYSFQEFETLQDARKAALALS